MAQSKPHEQDDTPNKPAMVSIKDLVSMDITCVSVCSPSPGFHLVELPDRGPTFCEKGIVFLWFSNHNMGLYMFFSLVAKTATLGNSCNLHKSKMAAIDSGWDTILQLVNSE